jgi:hypothetical protein
VPFFPCFQFLNPTLNKTFAKSTASPILQLRPRSLPPHSAKVVQCNRFTHRVKIEWMEMELDGYGFVGSPGHGSVMRSA